MEDVGKTSILVLLGKIGAMDSEGGENNYERCGEKLDGVEMELFADLLEKMLHCRPEERLTMSEVVSYPWFSLE